MTLSRLVATAGLLFLVACGPNIDPATLPAIPKVDVSGYQGAVREQLEHALVLFNKKPLRDDVNGELGKLYRVYRDFEAAEVLLRRARLLAPRNVEWAYYHGEVLERLADYQGALDAMLTVLEREPQDVGARVRAAKMHMALGNLTTARTMLIALIQDHPDVGDAQVAYAQLLTRDGKFEDAAQVWEGAIEQFGSFKNAHYALSQLYRRLGDAQRSADHLWQFEVTVVEEPPAVDPRLQTIFQENLSDRALVRAAQAAKRSGDAARALALLEQARERNPDNLETRAALILGYAVQADFATAQRHADEGLALNPEHAELGLAVGRLSLAQGNVASAVEHLSGVVSRSPKHTGARAWLARARQLGGDTAGAGQDFRAAIALDPRHPSARRFYVAWLMAHASSDTAMAELAKLAEKPALDVPLILSSMAQLAYRSGEVDRAIALLDRGIDVATLQGQAALKTKLANQRQKLAIAAR